jgi:GNAT superfamily N-acetyltransferase
VIGDAAPARAISNVKSVQADCPHGRHTLQISKLDKADSFIAAVKKGRQRCEFLTKDRQGFQSRRASERGDRAQYDWENALSDRIEVVKATRAAEAVGILQGVTHWLKARGHSYWSVDEFRIEEFEAAANAGELVMGFEGDQGAAVMLLQRMDPRYWPTEPPGAALYIHKLAVRRISAGRRWGARLIEWAAGEALARGVGRLRLDTVLGPVLPSMYEQQGFIVVDRYPMRVGPVTVIRMERALQ